jgi:hypothetical protein
MPRPKTEDTIIIFLTSKVDNDQKTTIGNNVKPILKSLLRHYLNVSRRKPPHS